MPSTTASTSTRRGPRDKKIDRGNWYDEYAPSISQSGPEQSPLSNRIEADYLIETALMWNGRRRFWPGSNLRARSCEFPGETSQYRNGRLWIHGAALTVTVTPKPTTSSISSTSPFSRRSALETRTRHRAFADQWGYESVETDWKELIKRDDIDAIDVCTPNNLHKEISIAAAEAGKMVLCEKPLAMNAADGEEMCQVVEKTGVKNMVWYNYRRVPAVTLAKQLIDEGRLGKIFHYRANFLQDWTINADVPQGGAATWRLDADEAGSGVTGDLLAHCIDTAIWLNGGITDVSAVTETFVKERKHAETGEVKEVKSTTLVPSIATSTMVRWDSSNRRVTPAATKRSTRSRSMARRHRSAGICMTCTASSTLTTPTMASFEVGAVFTSATATNRTWATGGCRD